VPKEEEQVFIRGRVPESVRARFKSACALLGRDMSGVLSELIERWLEEVEPQLPTSEPEVPKVQPKSIAELVQQNFYQLLTDGKITPDHLKAIAAGEKPSNADLSQIAHTLNMREEDLLQMRDRSFPNQPERK
jgi:hypothetical protein